MIPSDIGNSEFGQCFPCNLTYQTDTISLGSLSLCFKIFTYLFILAALGLSCGTQDLCCGMWTSQLQHADAQLQHVNFLVVVCKLLVVACMRDLVPQPGVEPGPPALGARSFTHWTTREVPGSLFRICLKGLQGHFVAPQSQLEVKGTLVRI